MKASQVERLYCKFYESIGFERIGLFECLKNEFGDRTVIYLGSSIHISPSFVFSSVTYVDNSEMARRFFSDEEAIVNFVERKKIYRRKPRIKYVNADYTNCEVDSRFSIVLAIFSPGTLAAAKQFLGDDSLLVYLPLPSEKQTTKDDKAYKVVGTIRMKKGKYRYSREVQENLHSKKDMIENKFNDVYAYSVLQPR